MKVIQKTKVLIVLMVLMALMPLVTTQAQVKIGQDAEPVKGAVLELNSNTGDYVGGLRLTNLFLANITDLSQFSEVPADLADLKGAIVYNTNPDLKDGTETKGIGIGLINDQGNGIIPESGLHILSDHNQHGGSGQSTVNIEAYKITQDNKTDNTSAINFKTSRGTFLAPEESEVDDVIGLLRFYVRTGELDEIGTVSDSRLKTNITPVKYGLSEIMKLKPVNYEMKEKSGVERIGFLAQEVKEVIPELVIGTEGNLEKGETLSITYGEFAPVLTKAIQEQQAQIESLLKIIEQLETRLKAVEETK